MNKKLLIINRTQFGYHSDTYYYCKYLTDHYDVTYLSWNYGLPSLNRKEIRYIDVSRQGPKLIRYCRFLWHVLFEVRQPYHGYFLKYFPGCFLLRILYPRKIFIFDIRTACVKANVISRFLLDKLLWFEALFFDHITVISESLADKLGLNNKKVHLLPLGADMISDAPKQFDKMNLLYIGTLYNRRVQDTVLGFHQFYRKYGTQLSMDYEIIGSGNQGEEAQLKKLVQRLGLEDVVRIRGYLSHDQAKGYFERQNIGLSYVPITAYFNCQPPTKTYEYALSGMITISTATLESVISHNQDSGILIDDNPSAVFNGLVELQQNLSRFDSNQIRQSYQPYLWKNIVQNNLLPYLDGLL